MSYVEILAYAYIACVVFYFGVLAVGYVTGEFVTPKWKDRGKLVIFGAIPLFNVFLGTYYACELRSKPRERRLG